MTAPLQLAFAVDALRDDLSPAEIEAAEATAAEQKRDLFRRVDSPPPCRCARPWPMRDDDEVRCVRCGRAIG